EVDDQTVKLKEELSYNKLPVTRAIELTDNRPAIQPHPYPPYPYYNPSLLPPPSLPVQFVLSNDNLQQNDIIEEKTKPIHTKRGGKRSGKTKSAKALIRKSPRKKGGIMNIAMEKIIEIPSADEDEIQDETKLKKSEKVLWVQRVITILKLKKCLITSK
ncbi:hypothetical protein RclHR1_03010001, partial [Rhizophagus clarus]